MVGGRDFTYAGDDSTKEMGFRSVCPKRRRKYNKARKRALAFRVQDLERGRPSSQVWQKKLRRNVDDGFQWTLFGVYGLVVNNRRELTWRN